MEKVIETASLNRAEESGGRWRIELEAAEALAALGHPSSSSIQNLNEDELEQRVQYMSSSSTDDSDQVEVIKACSPEIAAMNTNSVNTSQVVEIKQMCVCNRSYLSAYGSRSRHNLTEAEKEERRMRRVVANRESARQTVRRRQAKYAELSRKAANLATENENLKREMEQAWREYGSLKSINKRLKTRVDKIEKAGEMETRGDLYSACSKAATSISEINGFPSNQLSAMPFSWPSAVQSSDPFHSPCACQKCIPIASHNHIPPFSKSDSDREQENLTLGFGTGTTVYMVPFPCYFPFHIHDPQPSDHNATRNEAGLNLFCNTSSSSKGNVHKENHHLLLPARIHSELSCSAEMILNPCETSDPLARDEGGETRSTRWLLDPSVVSVEPSHKPKDNISGDIRTIPSATANAPEHGLPEKSVGPVVFPNEKSVDAILAAQARRRRKELKKLKNLHCSDCRMH